MLSQSTQLRAAFHATLTGVLLIGGGLASPSALAAQAPTDTLPAPPAPLTAVERAGSVDPVLSLPLDTRLPLDPEVRAGQLENGLRYFIRRNTKPEHRLELRLAVDAGSILEREDERGLAHFVEHMAFNGTRRFAKQAIVHYLESVGMRFGADLNAYTGFDETVYMLTLPSDRPDAVARGIEILGDWAQAISFDSVEVELERPVVIEEWRQGQGVEARLRDAQLPVVFQGSRYAERLPIGDTAVVRNATAAQLRGFYESWYRPELMTVVAVGDVDPAATEADIRRRFGALKNPSSPEPRIQTPLPGHARTLISIVRDEEATSTSVGVLYKRDAARMVTLRDYRSELVAALYDHMFNSRLYELAQSRDAPFLGAGSSKARIVRGGDAYTLGAAVVDSGVIQGLRAILLEAARADRHGFTASELERARSDVMRAMERAFDEREKTVSSAYAGEYVDAGLEGTPYLSTEDAWTLHQRFLPTITLAEVNSLARALISDSNRVVLVTAPAREDIQPPGEEELLAVFDEVDAASVDAYVDEGADSPLVATLPEAGPVTETRVDTASGVVEWRLDNGARVLLKPTSFKDDEILLAASSPGGNSLAPDSTFLSASMSATIATIGGAGTLDQVQLEKALAGKAVRVSPSIGQTEEAISGAASPRDLETLLQLVHLYFTAPRRDSVAFAAFQTRVRAYLDNRDRSPEAALADTLQVVLTSHNPRALPLTMERFDTVELDRALEFYRDRFSNAGDFTFVLVGNVDTAAVRPMVERWLGSLPATGRLESWRDVGIHAPDGVVKREVRRGLEPKAQTRLVFHGPATATDLAERYAMAAMSELLEMRLRDRLREELGGTYGVSVSGSLSRVPRAEFAVSIAFGSAPLRVEELTSAVFAEVGRLSDEDASPEEMDRVKEILRRALETGAEQNGYWLSQILAYDRDGLPLSGISQEVSFVDALTTARVREAAGRYLDREQYVLVSLLPER